MSTVEEQGRELRASRLERGMSAGDLATAISRIAEADGHPLKLTQQAVSAFENNKLKSIPRWLGYARKVLAAEGDVAPAPDEETVLIPVASAEFTLGGGGDIEDSFIADRVPFSRKWLRNLGFTDLSKALLQPTRGDSMTPTITDRDMVLVDRGDTEVREPDLIWSLIYAGQGYVKRLRWLPGGRLEAISDNQLHKPIIMDASEVQIVGQVISALKWRL